MVYAFAGFLELYNNSDTTIYLDGTLVGFGPHYTRDGTTTPSGISCGDGAPYQLDPDGLWSQGIWRVPGTGSQHPLAPGRAAVLATDAINHGEVDPRLPDLSAADFEFIGSQDADNPTVANLAEVGPQEAFNLGGHGALFWSDVPWWVAKDVDLDLQPRAQLPGSTRFFLRIPRASILDVFMSVYVPAVIAAVGLPLCPQLLSPVFDRQPASLLDAQSPNPGTIVRKVFTTLPDGRVILLRTRATANDFERLHVAGTPGRVP
jgi:hypothetical protein